MKPEDKETNESAMSEAGIDEALKESFPASDPAPWTLGTDPHLSREQSEANHPTRKPQ